MVYIEKQKKRGKVYNYLVFSLRENNKWKKVRKYIGKGVISRDKLEKAKREFSYITKKTTYLSEEQVRSIEDVRKKFNEYLKKLGKLDIEKFNEWFFTELTYNSNAIEGSTLGLRETSLIINENIVPKNTTLREINEAKNHKDALEFLLEYKGDTNEKLILKLHSIILKNINEKNKGKYREVPVFIVGEDIKFPHHSNVPQLVKALIKWYKFNKNRLHPLELAVLFSMKFVSIHPFIDGNGRVSRLLMNYILKKKKYPEVNIYVKDRNNYMKAVRKANDEDYSMIIDFAFKTVEKNYDFLKEL